MTVNGVKSSNKIKETETWWHLWDDQRCTVVGCFSGMEWC